MNGARAAIPAVAIKGALAVILVLSPVFGSAGSVVAVLLSVGLMPLALDRRRSGELLQAPAQVIFAAAFLALTLVFAITARAPGDVLYFANFLALPMSGLVYLWARSAAGPRTAALLTSCCIAGAAVAAGFAAFDVYGRGLPRAMGLIGNPNLVPRIALTLGFVALAGAMLTQTRQRWLYLSAPLLALVVTYLSGSRGAALAVPVMAGVAAVFLWRDRNGRLLVLVAAAGLAMAIAGLVVLGGADGLTRFAGIAAAIGESLFDDGAGVDHATSERLEMYRAGVAAFLEAPWLGWGWAHLGTAAAAVDPGAFAQEAGSRFMFHNDLIDFAVAGGLVGILCWVALLVAPLVGAFATPRDALFGVRMYCCLQLSLGYAVFGLTDMTLGYDLPTTLYAFLTAIVLGAFREEPAAAPA